ncbi:hypothetical protein LWC35_34965 [Pseudonocardia kujensis]|uniref:hypothetical protein n=1 Tax=Pseudonocardia kujensis TaxID=1128675 RepID=UPI001E2B6650|nr:hypothetical protein [Pseudonocardia kujensis]MCE0768063.1 hypothetical protein [Pseudonocardia kujensis]
MDAGPRDSSRPPHGMDPDRAALVRAFAALRGRPVDDSEVRAVLEKADGLGREELNTLWRRHERAPHTVDYRSQLALVLRFVELGRPG